MHPDAGPELGGHLTVALETDPAVEAARVRVAGHLDAGRAVAAGERRGIRHQHGADALAVVVGVDEEVLQLTHRAGAERRREPHDGAVGGRPPPGCARRAPRCRAARGPRGGPAAPGRRRGSTATPGGRGRAAPAGRRRRRCGRARQDRSAGAAAAGAEDDVVPARHARATLAGGRRAGRCVVGPRRRSPASADAVRGVGARARARARASHPRGRRRRSGSSRWAETGLRPRAAGGGGACDTSPARSSIGSASARGRSSPGVPEGEGRRRRRPRLECSRIAAIRSIGSCGARWCTAWSTPPSASMS